MEIKIIYEVSTNRREEAFDTLHEARKYAIGFLKSDAKDYASVFIHQMIYVDGVFEKDERIDFFFKRPDASIEWCFRKDDAEPIGYYDFFLKEESND